MNPRPAVSRRLLCLFACLDLALVVGLLEGCFLDVDSRAAALPAALLLVVLGAVFGNLGGRDSGGAKGWWRRWAVFGAGAFALVFALARTPATARLFLVSLTVAAIAWRSRGGGRRSLTNLSVATSCLGVFCVLRDAGSFSLALPRFAAGVASALAGWTTVPLRRGSLELALPLLLWGALGVVIGLRASRRHRWLHAGLAFAALALLLLLQAWLARPALAWVGVASILACVAVRGGPPGRSLALGRRVVGALALACVGVVLALWLPRGASREGRVLVAADGYYDLRVASQEAFGPDLRGPPSFGLLRDLLELCGRRLEVLDAPFSRSSLSGASVLLLINPTRPLERSERAALDAWLREGGQLLVLADHTNVLGQADVLAPVLEPLGIRFNFDSTCPADGSKVWSRGVASFLHPVTAAWQDPGSLRAGIGASLELSGAARPLLLGQAGFSDRGQRGDPQAGGLGNLQRDPWERTGDIVLAAEAPWGAGRALVFGDTQSFHNDSLPRTWRFVAGVFDALQAAPQPALRGVGAGLLLAGVLALTFWRVSTQAQALAAGALFAVTVGVVAGDRRVWTARLPQGGGLPIAVVDLSHHPQGEAGPWKPSGYDGLFVNLRRAGYFPVALHRWEPDVVARALLMVVPPSFAEPSATEREDLGRLLSRGGRVVLATGRGRARGFDAWLAGHGLVQERMPLGPNDGEASEVSVPAPVFRNPWPWRVPQKGKVLVRVGERPVVVRVAVDAGDLIAIGDDRLLTNQDLESLSGYSLRNVAFSGWVFSQASAGRRE